MGGVLTDIELLEASRRGERSAFGHLVERYQSLVCAVSYSATGDRVLSEDVAQETFLAAWRQLDQLREPKSLRSWLCGIARNLGRRARRDSGREAPIDESPVMAAPDASPFERTATAESHRIVWQALRQIPESHREALVLYYRENRSAREVRLVVKPFPVLPGSAVAAQAAHAAQDQGRFWELHDLMYANQDDLSKAALLLGDGQIGLDVERFRDALEHERFADDVAADLAVAEALGVRGTPSYFINGKLFAGARPIDEFRTSIDAELTN